MRTIRKLFALAVLLGIPAVIGCSGVGEEIPDDALKLTVEPGDEWIHAFSATTKNAPQMAVWIESPEGEYLDTVFVTRKIATEGWIFNKGNRRIESLPRWMYRRNIRGSDGILLPSKREPLADGITGASPKKSLSVLIRPRADLTRFRVVLEINHSTDFNEHWPKHALKGNPDWTGGTGGSGQPSVVYSVLVDTAQSGPWILTLDGHGSPDGSTDAVNPDVSTLSTALRILNRAVLAREDRS